MVVFVIETDNALFEPLKISTDSSPPATVHVIGSKKSIDLLVPSLAPYALPESAV